MGHRKSSWGTIQVELEDGTVVPSIALGNMGRKLFTLNKLNEPQIEVLDCGDERVASLMMLRIHGEMKGYFVNGVDIVITQRYLQRVRGEVVR